MWSRTSAEVIGIKLLISESLPTIDTRPIFRYFGCPIREPLVPTRPVCTSSRCRKITRLYQHPAAALFFFLRLHSLLYEPRAAVHAIQAAEQTNPKSSLHFTVKSLQEVVLRIVTCY
ncbi:hypothetical protein MPTK1_6g02480 [Marchantia polymorpha subsp. ruderalis]|uniref:Uncharacterized protein n=2 Tax=Marchantia polymorpha TaxID=3197 RepID=A0AAF6BMS0_MARPO|nr:hypothetical protein MARPO_0035s0033 [Marchantia polymorpha]BBN13304.1 hypothetical protein Mp_6g02480 [Marchantia polymorpha subsp. ruderalis]|eukprot:PTQ41230.1 hypothetical protein MARPO_0035s0033 [Marchantia polymorpha]